MKTVNARQLTEPTQVLVGTPPDLQWEQGEEGEWLVNDKDHQFLRSNRQFEIMYEPTEREGVYRER